MTPSGAADLLDQLFESHRTDLRPWGVMRWMDAPRSNVTIKYLTVMAGARTSFQVHKIKDELLIILEGSGYVDVDGMQYGGGLIRIHPGTPHRVTGPLSYLEVSSYDDDTDTYRLEDDYGR